MIDSLGAVAYIFIVVLFLSNAEKIFGRADNKILAPVIMLTLFVLSALITSLLILGKPAMLYFDGQKKEGTLLLIYTIISLAVLFVLVVLAYLGLR